MTLKARNTCVALEYVVVMSIDLKAFDDDNGTHDYDHNNKDNSFDYATPFGAGANPVPRGPLLQGGLPSNKFANRGVATGGLHLRRLDENIF